MGSVFELFKFVLVISMLVATSVAQVEMSTVPNLMTTPVQEIEETAKVNNLTTTTPAIIKKEDVEPTVTPSTPIQEVSLPIQVEPTLPLVQEVPLTDPLPTLQEVPSTDPIQPFHEANYPMRPVHYPYYPMNYYNPVIPIHPTYIYAQRPAYIPTQLYPQRPLYYPFPTYQHNIQPHNTHFYPNAIVQNHKTGGAAFTQFYPSPPDHYRNQFIHYLA